MRAALISLSSNAALKSTPPNSSRPKSHRARSSGKRSTKSRFGLQILAPIVDAASANCAEFCRATFIASAKRKLAHFPTDARHKAVRCAPSIMADALLDEDVALSRHRAAFVRHACVAHSWPKALIYRKPWLINAQAAFWWS